MVGAAGRSGVKSRGGSPGSPGAPNGGKHPSSLAPGLSRVTSLSSLLPGASPQPASWWDRLHRHRPLKAALVLLITVVAAANVAWVGATVASAWRRGGAGGGFGLAAGAATLPSAAAPQLLHRLNTTTLSVQVSRVSGENGTAQQPDTFLVTASEVDAGAGGAGAGSGRSSDGGGAGGDAALDGSAAAAKQRQQQQQQPPTMVAQLGGLGGVLQGVLRQASKRQGGEGGGGDQSSRGGKVATMSVVSSTGSRRDPGRLVGAAVTTTPSPTPTPAPAPDTQQAAAAQAVALAAAVVLAPPTPQPEQAGAAAAGGDAGPTPATHAGQLWQGGRGREAPEGSSANASTTPSPASPAPTPPHRALLKPPEVDAVSADACSQALNSPKVALMFLTKGDLFHEPSWRMWFESAAGMLPSLELRDAMCGVDRGAEAVERVQGACLHPGAAQGKIGAGGLLDAQHLFSVYIHAPPNLADADLPELFRGRLIQDRLSPEWGTHQLVEATRNLLWAAFKDPANTRFVLLSESDIPLYDPLTLWRQLQSEGRSRINACPGDHTMPWRYSWRMVSAMQRRSMWRKSSQWFGLMRQHAEVVLRDQALFRAFEAHCVNAWDKDYRRWRDCFSDEHYMPTLLAVKGLTNETTCDGFGVSHTDWSAGGPHPNSYRSWEVKPELILKARGSDDGSCNSAAAIQDAQRTFVRAEEVLGGAGAAAACASGGPLAEPLPSYDNPMPTNCTLTSRKFPKSTAMAVESLFTDCDDGRMHLLRDDVCRRHGDAAGSGLLRWLAPAAAGQEGSDLWGRRHH